MTKYQGFPNRNNISSLVATFKKWNGHNGVIFWLIRIWFSLS